MKSVSCEVISGGIAMGRALNLTNLHPISKLNSDDIINEIRRLDDAIVKSIKQLNDIKEKIVNRETASFIDSHIFLLKDIVFYQEIVNYVMNERCNVEYAFEVCIDKYIENLKSASSNYLSERASDIIDVKNRVINNLFNQAMELKAKRSTILFVDELLPSQVLTLSQNIRGVIARKGGKTSHSAILCNSLNITYVLCDEEILDDEAVIIDPKNALVISSPDDKTICEYEYLFFDRDIDDSVINRNQGAFKIKANISSNAELRKVTSNNLDGVGLYRTEFLFMAKGHVSSIEEQKQIYEEASKKIYPNSVVIRTFDIGDDKNLPYVNLDKKRASNYFKYITVFENQVRAIILANEKKNLKIMFPMIETKSDYDRLKAICMNIAKEENREIEIGMMLETKEALENIENFYDVPFMSIGTNDLMSELYGFNRLSISNYDMYIDDLLARLRHVVLFALENNIELSLCGEIGSHEKYLVKLIDIGIKIFSCNVQSIPEVIKVVSKKRLEK